MLNFRNTDPILVFKMLIDMFILVFLVTCSFRGSVPQGLVLEIGETVQILEKCEGKCGPMKHTNSDHLGQYYIVTLEAISWSCS